MNKKAKTDAKTGITRRNFLKGAGLTFLGLLLGTPKSSAGYDGQVEVGAYLAPYVGNIDGEYSPDCYAFYDQIRKWHEDNEIPVALSFYPSTMNNEAFNRTILRMYNSPSVELVLKGEAYYDGTPLETMPYDNVKAVIKGWVDKFTSEMRRMGITYVKTPTAYNQLMARFTETIRDAVHDLGFKIYFEQYVSDLGYIAPLPDFDIIQYSVSLTESGYAGSAEEFKSADQFLEEVLDFNHEHLVKVNGIKVVPSLVHQQDFRTSQESCSINQQKWNLYKEMLLKAKEDPRIEFITPEQIYERRH